MNFGSYGEPHLGVESEIIQADREALESRTLSHLAALETALGDYVRAESKMPDHLEALVPKYLSEIPAVELGVPAHRDTAEVEYYPPSVIRDGAIDGARLKDTGRWGYVHSARQAIVFIDCAHKDSRGKPWYLERGAF